MRVSLTLIVMMGGQYSLLQHANGTTYLNSAVGKAIHFRESNADKMVLSNGKLGIGTVSPACPLHVVGSGVISINSFAEYGHTATAYWTPSSGYLPRDISIHANESILARRFYAQSDKRIKENIVDVVDNQALDLLRLLKPKKYQYKDKRDYPPVENETCTEVPKFPKFILGRSWNRELQDFKMLQF